MKRYTDPITGDELTFGEHISWLAQGLIRRWPVLLLLQATAVVWLVFGDDTARTWWNYAWSDLAVIIEGIVGIAMFSQTRRDAVAIREIRKLASVHKDADDRRDLILTHLEALLDHHGVERPS